MASSELPTTSTNTKPDLETVCGVTNSVNVGQSEKVINYEAGDNLEEDNDEEEELDADLEEPDNINEDTVNDNLDALDINGDEERETKDMSDEDDSAKSNVQNEFQFDCGDAGLVNNSEFTAEEAKLAGHWADGDKIITARVNAERRFVCVEFPALVKNVDKAIQAMDGKESISKTISSNGRLGVCFRPDDPFSKSVYTSCTFSQNLLIRVRRRKKKKKAATQQDKTEPHSGGECGASLEDEDPYEYKLIVEGIVDRVYSFDGFCDFQYLPVVRQNQPKGADNPWSNSYEEILSKIIPGFDDQRQEYFARDAPLYLPPLTFSRRQQPTQFVFEDDHHSERKEDVIETERKQRFLGTIHLTFDHPNVPMEPHPDGILSLEKLPKAYREAGLASIQKLFKDRPLWSKAGLQLNMEPQFRRYVTYLLPMVAYFITNGAWKCLWCRLGYDPRANPEAKIYQVVDFRVRHLDRHKVVGKRELLTRGILRYTHQLPPSKSGGKEEPTSSNDFQFFTNTNATYQTCAAKDVPKDVVYKFHRGVMPPYRQMRYQVCDIIHPEVQAKMHENDGKETECTERDGWAVPDFTNVCRDIIHKEVHTLQLEEASKSS